MYSSNSSLNGNNNLTFSSKTFSFESNLTSSKDDNINSPFPFSFFQFPYSDIEYPFQDNNNNNNNHIFQQQHDDHDFQLHDHHHHHQPVAMNNTDDQPSNSIINTNNNNIDTIDKGKKVVEVQIQRKRSSKRDRHSKIKTAKGLRDRRMRLSLEVAKRFFGLQDMLGFEKASKTVDWLLNQSKVEIKHLAREKNLHFPSKSASSTSECEGVSSLDNEVVVSGNQEQQQQQKVAMKRRRNSTNKVCRKSAFNSIGREKARERARERTREKINARNSKQCINDQGTKTNLINCWNPFETVEESESTHQSQSLKLIEIEERNSQANKDQHLEDMTHEDNSLFINMNKWSPTTVMFNSLNNLQENQFSQFHESMEKPWEAYNNRI